VFRDLPNTQKNSMDLRTCGLVRSMDVIMYVLYSDDQKFVRDMVTKVLLEVADEQQCKELALLAECEQPQLYVCLFFLLLDFHAKFRYWVLQETGIGLKPVCPHKAGRFLRVLRADIVPKFLINETLRMDDFERELKVEYLRS
jgi:hypothetical protein